MTESFEHTIRARRAASNRAIAMRDADLTVAFMLPDVTVAVAGGPVLVGREAQRQAFADQFADRSFHGYVRTPTDISVHPDTTLATERGVWVGTWLRGLGTQAMRGSYVAEWRFAGDAWLLRSEIFT